MPGYSRRPQPRRRLTRDYLNRYNARTPMRSNEQPGISRWWRVAGALLMNLALGTLYAWSVFVAPLEQQFGWKRAETSMVFTIAVMAVALSFLVAGRLQDKFGPLYCSLAG